MIIVAEVCELWLRSVTSVLADLTEVSHRTADLKEVSHRKRGQPQKNDQSNFSSERSMRLDDARLLPDRSF